MIYCKFKSPSTNNIKNSNTGNKQEVIMTELQCWWVLSEGAYQGSQFVDSEAHPCGRAGQQNAPRPTCMGRVNPTLY